MLHSFESIEYILYVYAYAAAKKMAAKERTYKQHRHDAPFESLLFGFFESLLCLNSANLEALSHPLGLYL